MVRRYEEPIEVRARAGERQPVQCGRWRTATSALILAADEEQVAHGLLCGVDGSTSSATSSGTGPSAGPGGGGARPARGLEPAAVCRRRRGRVVGSLRTAADLEQDVWRVEASPGRLHQAGVYDLAREGRAMRRQLAAAAGRGLGGGPDDRDTRQRDRDGGDGSDRRRQQTGPAAPRTAARQDGRGAGGRPRTGGRAGAPPAVPVHAPVAAAVLELVDRSRASLLAACRTSSVSERYVEAHLAALRAAAALLAARSRPTRRSRLRSVWEVLPAVAPELTEWAVFFAGTAAAAGGPRGGPGCRRPARPMTCCASPRPSTA